MGKENRKGYPMKHFMGKSAIAGIVMQVVLSPSWAGDFNYASYTQTTIQDILSEEHNQSLDQVETQTASECIHLEYRVSKHCVSCQYSDRQRPISKIKKNVIKLWLETLDIDPKLGSLYDHEIQVTDGNRTHWIPIQKQLIPCINRELVKNDPIVLFIMLIGKVDSEFVLIATEFEKPIPPARNSIQATACTKASP
jgi:hypothetical protein